MKKILRKNKELILPITISILILIMLIFLDKKIYLIFIGKDINNLVVNIGLALTGFLLTAYTIFLGFQNQVSKKIKETFIIDKINQRFVFSIYVGLSLFILGILFIFLINKILFSLILSIFILLILLIFLLIDYLRLLFKNIKKK